MALDIGGGIVVLMSLSFNIWHYLEKGAENLNTFVILLTTLGGLVYVVLKVRSEIRKKKLDKLDMQIKKLEVERLKKQN